MVFLYIYFSEKMSFLSIFDIQYGSQVKTRLPLISIFCMCLVRLLSTENVRFMHLLPTELYALKNGPELKNHLWAQTGENF